MNNKNLLYVAVGLVILIVLFLIVVVAPAQVRANEPTPTPTLVPPTETPTKVPLAVVKSMGGDIFTNSAADLLASQYGISVDVNTSIATFDMKNQDLSKYDCIFPGSENAFNEFVAAHAELSATLRSVKAFWTYGVIVTRRDLYYPYFEKYGISYKNDAGQYVIRYGIIVSAMERKLTYGQMFKEQAEKLSVEYAEDSTKQFLSWPVNVGHTNPLKSGGGAELVTLNLDYARESGAGTISAAEITPDLYAFVKDNLKAQHLQDTSSPTWFNTWKDKSRSYPLGATSESLVIGWYNSLTDKSEADKIVMMYPETTVSTTHIVACWTQPGYKLVQAFKENKDIQLIGANKNGMHTKALAIGQKPGNTDMPGVASEWDAFETIDNATFQIVKQALLEAKAELDAEVKK